MADNTPLNSGAKIGVPFGGTDLASITDHSVMIGSGSAAVTPIAVGTSGQLLIGWTAADPAFGSSAVADFEFTSSTAGVNRELKVVHTDNTNAASSAHVQVTTGGASGGDPYINVSTGVNTASFGMDNSDADILKITTGASPSAGTTYWAMTVSGERTMALQPAFLAIQTAAQLNLPINATTTLTINNEIFDQHSDYNAGTYTFTAPITGRYYLHASMEITSADKASRTYSLQITTSNRNYNTTLYLNYAADPTTLSWNVGALADMDTGDTAVVQVVIPNLGASQADVVTTGSTNFSGALIC